MKQYSAEVSMLGIVSYAFNVFSKLRSDSVVLSTKNQQKIDFSNFLLFLPYNESLEPKTIFSWIRVLKGMFWQKKKKIDFFTSVLRFSIFSENGS